LLARLGSAFALSLQADVEPSAPAPVSDTLQRVRQALCQARFRVAIYVALLAFGTQVAAPFFTPYMLRELRLDYQAFALLSAVSILAKALVFPCCHHLAARFGLRNLLWCAGVGVAVVPLVWAASPDLSTLVLANALGGVAWAGLEYSSFQLLLESAPRKVKTEFFSLSSTLTGVGQVTGALGGGLLLERHALAYQQLFVVSALLRALSLSTLFLAIRAGDFPGHLRALYTRVQSVRPGAGADQRPIVDAGERD
jgi:MFS family permease